MEKTTYSIWLQNSTHNQVLLDLIDKFAKEESKDSFFPHVTLVTHISSEEEALNILSKLRINKDEVVFDKISSGDTFFQKLYLEASDNSYFLMQFQCLKVGLVYGYRIYLCATGMSYPNLLIWGSLMSSSL